MKKLLVDMDASLHSRFKAWCARHGYTVSDVIRGWVVDTLMEEEWSYEVRVVPYKGDRYQLPIPHKMLRKAIAVPEDTTDAEVELLSKILMIVIVANLPVATETRLQKMESEYDADKSQ